MLGPGYKKNKFCFLKTLIIVVRNNCRSEIKIIIASFMLLSAVYQTNLTTET